MKLQEQKHYYGFNKLPNNWIDDNDKQYSDEFFNDKKYEDLYFDNFFDMDQMFGHENSLFGTRGLPVGHPKRTSKSFDRYNKVYGPIVVRVIKDKNLQENINRIKEVMGVVNEETESKKEIIKSMIKSSGLDTISTHMGGVENLINIVYDGDIVKFSEDTTTPLVYMSDTKMNLYLHEGLVKKLGFQDIKFRSGEEKDLGDFSFGSKNGLKYKFTARLYPTKLNGLPYYKVVGLSGDSGFGYGFISKKNTLGSRYRQQIFKQIIDRYNLEPYMKVKGFN